MGVYGSLWGALVVVMCGRCDRATTAAETRFARLVEATEKEGLSGDAIPGRLYVGSCSDAVQRAGHFHEHSMDTQ